MVGAEAKDQLAYDSTSKGNGGHNLFGSTGIVESGSIFIRTRILSGENGANGADDLLNGVSLLLNQPCLSAN